jgi:hypothetical protein
MVRTTAALMAVLLTASAAQADWQFTKWGMSEAELTAISENIEPTTPAERSGMSNPYVGTALYRSGYTAMDVKFTAYYIFDAGKLAAVSLKPVDLENWPKVNIALDQIYGPPVEDKSKRESGGTMFCSTVDKKWRDEREKNIVTAFGLSCNRGGNNFFSIKYMPILSAGRNGL